MKSIYSTFTGLFKDGKPIDFLATWKKALDKASEREVALFQKTYSDEWFDWEAPQLSLRAEGIMGKYHLRVMATLIGDESPTPLRRSDGFDIWNEEIPRVGHKFFMKASTYRKLLEVYKSPFLKDGQKVKQIEKTLRNDLENAYLGCKDTADFMILNAISNFGICRFKPEINNPGGREFEIDYLMEEANKLVSALLWNEANSKAGKLDIILTLTMIVTLFKNMGVYFEEMLMAPELIAFIRRDINIRESAYGKDKSAKVVSVADLNTLFTDNGLPKVREITRLVAIEKDGDRQALDPWNHNMIVFKPAGKVGFIQPAIEDNELFEEDNVDYMDAGNGIRIAKWRTGESTGQKAGEYTQGSARLIPVINEINGLVCFQVRGFEELKTIEEGVTFFKKETYDSKKASEASATGVNVG